MAERLREWGRAPGGTRARCIRVWAGKPLDEMTEATLPHGVAVMPPGAIARACSYGVNPLAIPSPYPSTGKEIQRPGSTWRTTHAL